MYRDGVLASTSKGIRHELLAPKLPERLSRVTLAAHCSYEREARLATDVMLRPKHPRAELFVGGHLEAAKALVQFPSGPGIDLIDIKNTAGRTPLGEAELAGWDEGAKWFVEVMKLEDSTVEEDANAKSEDVGDEDDEYSGGDIQVEIEDADGGIARMSISSEATKKASTLS